MTYNIDPAGVQGVLSKVTDAGILLTDTLSKMADIEAPLTAGLKSPLEDVSAAVLGLFEREHAATAGMTNSINAGISAAITTSLAYIHGDDEMASNAVRAAQQAALDGNFDYFTTGEGRYVPPPAPEETSTASFSQTDGTASSESAAGESAASFEAAPSDVAPAPQEPVAVDTGTAGASGSFETRTPQAADDQTIDSGTEGPVSPVPNAPVHPTPAPTPDSAPTSMSPALSGSASSLESTGTVTAAVAPGAHHSDFVERLREEFGAPRRGHRFEGGRHV